MNEYEAPLEDMRFAMKHSARLAEITSLDALDAADLEMVDGLLEESGRFAREVISPLNRIGDTEGAKLIDGQVVLPTGYKEAYRGLIEAGWNRIASEEEFGGAGLPFCVHTAVIEMFGAANMAFSMCAGISDGAIHLIAEHASDDLKAIYLEKMVLGEWTGCMDLTEPEAGSDLGALRCQATVQSDGSYQIHGTKVFISFGDHDLAENVIHLVLARTPDAPAGSRGISLFLVPKFLVNPDGSLGPSNGIETVSLEHKLGIRVSPTCVLSYGASEPCEGYLIGSENSGLMAMFTMMNRERIYVGNQSLAISQRAYQQALEYAQEREQGRAVGDTPAKGARSKIIEHPDVRRMLMTMRAQIEAMRGMIYALAAQSDISAAHPDQATRDAAANRFALITPVVKAWFSDLGVEITSLGIQVHGGVGYIEETGAAQHFRDARIPPIYEGTNGVQAMDLVMRKLGLEEGRTLATFLDELRSVSSDLGKTEAGSDLEAGLSRGIEALADATKWLQERMGSDPRALAAGASPYLRLFGVVAGAAELASQAVAAAVEDPAGWSPGFIEGKTATARFFIEQLLPQALGLLPAITAGSDNLFAIEASKL